MATLAAIYPADSEVIDYFRGEPVYSRSCVHNVNNYNYTIYVNYYNLYSYILERLGLKKVEL